MAYMNQNNFIGRFGSDLEVKTFESNGGKVGRVSIAVTKVFKKQDGTKAEKTIWVPLEFPEHLVENAAKLVTKGRLVLVTGELETYDAKKDNVEYTGFKVRVEDYQLLDPKPADKAE